MRPTTKTNAIQLKDYLKLHPEDPMGLGKSIYPPHKPIADYNRIDWRNA